MDLSVGGKKKLLSLVDALPQGPEFQCTPLKVVGDIIDERGNKREEILDVWHRDPVEVIADLLENISFKDNMKWVPERRFRDRENQSRV